MPGLTTDNILRQQFEDVIEDELHKLEFASLCKKIALKVVDRVHEIDDEHNKIKSLYGELGARVASLLAESGSPRTDIFVTPECFPTQNNGVRRRRRRRSNETTMSRVDEKTNNGEVLNGSNNGDSHAVNSSGLSSTESPSLHPIASSSSRCDVDNNDSDQHRRVNLNGKYHDPTVSKNPVNLNGNYNNITVSENQGVPGISNGGCVEKVSVRSNEPFVLTSGVSSSPQDATSEHSISHSRVEDCNVEDCNVEDCNVEEKESDEPQIDIMDEHESVPSSDVSGEDVVFDDMAAAIGTPLSPNTVTSTAVSNIDISESDVTADSRCSSITPDDLTADSQCSSIAPDDLTEDSQSSIAVPDDVTAHNQSSHVTPHDNPVKNRSPLILKLKAVPESTNTAETSKYSSTMVSPTAEQEDAQNSGPIEVSSSSCTVRKPRRKAFRFKAGSIAYAKPCESDLWYEAELQREVFHYGKKQPKLHVRFMGGQRLKQSIHLNSIATKDPVDPELFEIGTRVVAGRPSDTVNSTISKTYKDISSGNNINVMFAGVVAELACEANRCRYLVFFDDGYAQYFTISSLFLIIKPSRVVWTDVPDVHCQSFLKRYLTEYPYRKLLCTTLNTTMQVEWSGELWKSKIVSIDASLIKVVFHVDKRSEWIYRGTERLEPLFRHVYPHLVPKKKKTESNGTYIDEKITHPQFGVSKYSTTDPYGTQQTEEWNLSSSTLKRQSSEGSVFDFDDVPEEKEKDKIMPKKLRVQSGIEGSKIDKEIEKSSTISSQEAFGLVGALQMSPTRGVPLSISQVSTPERFILRGDTSGDGAHLVHEPPTPPRISWSPQKRGPHQCDKSCIKEDGKVIVKHNVGICNYLSIPFKLGWRRESVKKKGRHRDVYYRAPCNKRLRNLAEVTSYLSLTKCTDVAIDMFCFSSSISCRNQPLRPKPTLAKIDDLSGGKEMCPIVCVNEMNDELPNPIVYISNRLPAEDVLINTDPGFLVCCDCVDNCEDKRKCGCAQLTIESSKAIDGVIDENAGYQFRQLKDTITTGIYECNKNCSCSRERCYNRVVQNGIQLRLQVFMTENRGWGLRCVDDIPKGTFVCTYVGQVLNEQTANKEGMDFGDEYLAELDHIEVVEKAKEDYEEDVPELRNNITISSDDDSDSDSSNTALSVSPDVSDNDDAGNDTVGKGCESGRGTPPSEAVSSEMHDGLFSSLQSISNRETNPMSNVMNNKISSVFPNEDDAVTNFDITDHSIAANPSISGKALARKSTSNKAFTQKFRAGKKSAKEAANANMSAQKGSTILTRSLYDGDKQMYVMDAKCFGNVGRFLNHSCSPNLFVQNVMVDTHDLRFPWVAFFAQQNIPAYTELTWNYNYEIGSVADKTLICKCGAKNCIGRLL